MTKRRGSVFVKPIVALCVAVAVGVAVYALVRLETLTSRPDLYRLDLAQQLQIDPQLIRYGQVAEIPCEVAAPQGVAVGPDDRIYVAGDGAIQVLRGDGQADATVVIAGAARCVAVGGREHVAPGRIYVGVEGRVYLFAPDGQAAGAWDGLGDRALVTSIAPAGEEVFVADAGNRAVLRLNAEGRILNTIGNSAVGRGAPGFIVPSPYFDVVAGPDGLLHAVNPGARRVETFAATGELEAVWGKAGSDVRSFFGCCNPSNLARLPDGRFVTSEKGIPRVKIYGSDGKFDCVVAGPDQLGVPAAAIGDPRAELTAGVFDVATDSQGRVLVLDPTQRCVRVFAPRNAKPDEHHATL